MVLWRFTRSSRANTQKRCPFHYRGFHHGLEGKASATMQETWVQSMYQKDPVEKEMVTHSSTLAWKIPWMEKPSRLQSKGSQRVRHDWARKSRNTWSNRQIWPWNTQWRRAKLIEFCQENALVIANTFFQQHRRLCTWISLDGQYQNQIDYILCSQRWRGSLESGKTRPGADCG